MFFDDGNKNINYNYKTEDVAKIKEIEFNREIELNKIEEKKRNDKEFYLFFIGLLLFLVIIIAFGFFMANREENNIKSKEAELQSVVNEIYIDIDAGKYDEALIKAQSLYYPGESESREKKWNDTRETIIQLIEEKKK